MYLARFETEDGEWLQAAAEVRARTPRSENGWWEELGRRLVAAALIPGATVARRISVDGARRLRQVVSVTAPAVHERRVRSIFAGITRLESLVGGSLQLPLSASDHDDFLQHLPLLRYNARMEVRAGGIPIACDYRLGPVLDDLIAEACLSGFALTYQVHVRATTPDPEWVRAARKNALLLDSTTGVRPALAARQAELAVRLAQSAALGDEFLAVDSAEAAEAVGLLLRDRQSATHAQFGIPATLPVFEAGAHGEELVVGVHSHDLAPLRAPVLAALALSPAERDVLLAWKPTPRLRALLEPDGGAWGMPEDDTLRPPDVPMPPADAAALASLPDPYAGEAPFGFVSYKRHDIGRVAPIMREVIAAGVPLWYDRGIPGGAEWNAVIEAHLVRSRFVLLFASTAAIESKFVRREVLLADTLDTPLLSVRLEAAELRHGMRMLLMQYQILDAWQPDFAPQLARALKTMM